MEDGLDAKTALEFRKIWLELQKEHFKLSSNSKQVFATNSGHYVQLDESQVVVNAVKELVERF